ncbi:unnamed protein product, partial [Pelagomonas calceolata]
RTLRNPNPDANPNPHVTKTRAANLIYIIRNYLINPPLVISAIVCRTWLTRRMSLRR